MRARLLDELWLIVHPILVGAGMRLFEEMTSRACLELVETKTFSTGVAFLSYRPGAT